MEPNVEIFEKALVFNMILWISKGYQWIILPEILRDICLRYHQGRKLFFIFRDGENPELSGALAWISQIAKEANISADRIIIQTYHQVDAPFATLEQLDIKEVFANNLYPPVSVTPINNLEFKKKMIALFGRFSIYRLRTAKFLYDSIGDNTLISFKDSKLAILDQLNRFDIYKEEADWVERAFPLPPVDPTPPVWPMSVRDIMYGIKKTYPKFFVDITIETDVYNPTFITEKTTRNFFFGKPFVVFAGPGYLNNIRQLGFKTFPELCDESYDNIQNTEERFQAFLQRIQTINSMPMEHLRKIGIEMQPTFEHNRNLMLEKNKIQSNNLLWTESYDSIIGSFRYL